MTNKKIIAVVLVFLIGGLLVYSFAATPSQNLKENDTQDNYENNDNTDDEDNKTNEDDNKNQEELENLKISLEDLKKELEEAKTSGKYTDESLEKKEKLINIASNATTKEEFEEAMKNINNFELVEKEENSDGITTPAENHSSGNNQTSKPSGSGNQGTVVKPSRPSTGNQGSTGNNSGSVSGNQGTTSGGNNQGTANKPSTPSTGNQESTGNNSGSTSGNQGTTSGGNNQGTTDKPSTPSTDNQESTGNTPGSTSGNQGTTSDDNNQGTIDKPSTPSTGNQESTGNNPGSTSGNQGTTLDDNNQGTTDKPSTPSTDDQETPVKPVVINKDEVKDLQTKLDNDIASGKYTDESIAKKQELIDAANNATTQEEYDKALEDIKNFELVEQIPTNIGSSNIEVDVSPTNSSDKVNVISKQNGTDIILGGSIETKIKTDENGQPIENNGKYTFAITVTAPRILSDGVLKNAKFRVLDNIYGIPTNEVLTYNRIANIQNIATQKAVIVLPSFTLRENEITNEYAQLKVAVDWGNGENIIYNIYFNDITINKN